MATIKPQTLIAIQRAAEAQQADITELKAQLAALVGSLPTETVAKALEPADVSPVAERLAAVEAKLDAVLAALEQPKGKAK